MYLQQFLLFLHRVFIGNWCETRLQSFLGVSEPNCELAVHIAVFLDQFQDFFNLRLPCGQLRQYVLPFLFKNIQSFAQNFLFLARGSCRQKFFAFLYHVVESGRVLRYVVGNRLGRNKKNV